MTKKKISIKDWSLEDRPREKLYTKGTTSLTDAELLAIILGSGNREESAVGLARRVLDSVANNLKDLSNVSIKDLCQFKGIGIAKAINIIAAMEIGRRTAQVLEKKTNKITCSKDVFNEMKLLLENLPHEEFWILFLNNANKILRKEQISKGGLTFTMVDVRVVLKIALDWNSVAMILIHNHPSGKLNPSKEDKKLTEKIKNAAKLIDIKVLDHLIVSKNGYYSFADEGIL